MNGQCFSNLCPCQCRNFHQNMPYNNVLFKNLENIMDEEDESARYKSYRPHYSCSNNAPQEEYPALDDHTWNTISSMRQKACNFINSESEYTSTSESVFHNGSRQCDNCMRDSKFLELMQGLMEYEPESQFLKKVKEQFLLENQQLLDMTPTSRQKHFLPLACQNCIDKSKRLFNFDNQEPCDRLRSLSKEYRNNNIGELDGCLRNLKNSDFQCKNSSKPHVNEEELYHIQENERRIFDDNLEKRKKKSQHVSRSKKPVVCRGRRKRKPDGTVKCESQELFEPTLKRPHENSCERCWRYASPARSPVNKPDQKYDPNFRKAHSCTEFVTNEKKDDTLEMTGSKTSPCKNLRPISPNVINESALTSQRPQQSPTLYSSNVDKTKSTIFEPQQSRKISEKNFRKPLFFEENQYSDSPKPGGLFFEDGKTFRAKSCTPGITSRNTQNFIDLNDKFDETVYRPINLKSRANAEFSTPSKPCLKNTKDQSSFKENNNSFRQSEHSDACLQYSERQRLDCLGSPGRTPKIQNKPSSGRRLRKTLDDSLPSMNAESSRSKTFLEKANSPRRPSTAHTKSTKNHKSPAASKSRLTKACRRLDFDSTPKRNADNCISTKSMPPDNVKESDYSQCPNVRPNSIEKSNEAFNNRCYDTGKLNKTHYFGPPHPIRECHCRPDTAPLLENFSKQASGVTFCCHCGQRRNLNNPNYDFNCRLASDFGKNFSFNEQSSPFSSPGFRNDNPLNQLQYTPVDSGSAFPFMSDFSDVPNFSPNRAEKIMACPYRQYFNSKSPLGNYSDTENSRRKLFENGNCQQMGRQTSSKFSQSNQFPRKYCVFYMTKNKEDNGNEVEVLVEELTQKSKNKCKEDLKTKNLTDKMKRVLECKSDSMALRFQKGVSESYKNPQSSRLLYF